MRVNGACTNSIIQPVREDSHVSSEVVLVVFLCTQSKGFRETHDAKFGERHAAAGPRACIISRVIAGVF